MNGPVPFRRSLETARYNDKITDNTERTNLNKFNTLSRHIADILRDLVTAARKGQTDRVLRLNTLLANQRASLDVVAAALGRAWLVEPIQDKTARVLLDLTKLNTSHTAPMKQRFDQSYTNHGRTYKTVQM